MDNRHFAASVIRWSTRKWKYILVQTSSPAQEPCKRESLWTWSSPPRSQHCHHSHQWPGQSLRSSPFYLSQTWCWRANREGRINWHQLHAWHDWINDFLHFVSPSGLGGWVYWSGWTQLRWLFPEQYPDFSNFFQSLVLIPPCSSFVSTPEACCHTTPSQYRGTSSLIPQPTYETGAENLRGHRSPFCSCDTALHNIQKCVVAEQSDVRSLTSGHQNLITLSMTLASLKVSLRYCVRMGPTTWRHDACLGTIRTV